MTVVSGVVEDVAGGPDHQWAWVFTGTMREGADGQIVTTKPFRIEPDEATGEIEVDLDPGVCTIQHRNRTYIVTVPEEGPVDLWDLIQLGVDLPPNTPQEQIATAVTAYLNSNASPLGVQLMTASTESDARDILEIPAQIEAAVDALVAGAPGALDTLFELSAALGDDENFATTVTAAIAAKYTKPGTGIPESDLAAAVSTSLGLADTSVQPGDPLADLDTAVTGAQLDALKTKVDGIASGATVNSSDATLLARENHTGTQSADTLTDGTTNKAFTAAEKTKLSGVETGADVTDAVNVAAAGATMSQDVSKTITVGSGGDFATLNDAIQEATRFAAQYDFSSGRLETPFVEIKQLSGFIMAEQVFVVGHDLSFITITSEDAEVTIDRSALTGEFGDNAVNWREGVFPAFTATRGGGLPCIKTLYSMDDSGTGYGTVGVYILENARGVIHKYCGVKNAGWRGLYVDGGYCYARASVWDGAGYADGIEGTKAGLRASNNAVVMFREASAKDCWNGAYISHAHVQLAYADFTDAGSGDVSAPGNGIVAEAATVVGAGTVADGARGAGLYLRYGSTATMEPPVGGVGLSALSCGNSAIIADDGSTCVALGADLSSTDTHAVYVLGGARVIVNESSITSDNGCGIIAFEGSRVSAMSATVEGTSNFGVRFYSSELYAVSAKIGGTSGGVQLNDGSILQQQGATELDGVSPLNLSALTGSIVLGGGIARLSNLSADRVNDTNGNTSLLFNPVASAVNYVRLDNAAAAGTPSIVADGSDSSVSLTIRPKGTSGVVTIRDGSSAQVASFTGASSAVNRHSFISSATGSPVQFAAAGSDTNIGIRLIPKGIGTVQVDNGIELGHASDTTVTRASAGQLAVEGNPLGTKVAVPSAASATGVPGQWAVDANFVYYCTATNTWVRAAVATW